VQFGKVLLQDRSTICVYDFLSFPFLSGDECSLVGAGISRQSIAQQCWESSIEFWDTMEGSEITSTSPFEEKTRQDAFGASCCLMEWHLGQLKIENGLNYLRRAESLAKGPEQYKELAKVAMESGSKLVSDDPTSAMAVLEKSSMFHEKVSDKVGQAKALRNIARCCIQLGDLERALNAAKLAATLQSRDQYSILLLLRVQLLVAELDGAASTLRELILLPISTCDAFATP
jgi:ATP/maltotriose-dependent transcriptional regulator MalT